MTKFSLLKRLRHKASLTALISVLIILVAIIPLVVTIMISQVLSRPQLISQSADAMAQDAHVRVQLIDAYLHARLHDVQTVSSLYAIQQFAQGDSRFKNQALKALIVGEQSDVNYDTWAVLDMQGHSLLSYPMPPRIHGDALIPPADLEAIQQSASAQISGVFYDPDVSSASVVIYMPILGSASRVVGIIRAEFMLTYIWNVVNSQADQAGSYAFILDQNGVRIAYNSGGSTLSRSSYLFKAIAPLSPPQQQSVVVEDLYGNNEHPLTVLSDPGLTTIQNDQDTHSRFELTPAEQQQTFEVIKVHITAVGWTYYALRPLKAIIAVADEQLFSTLLIAAMVLILAIIIGVASGRRITQPIQRSIEQQKRAIEQQQHAYEQQQYLNQLKDQILVNVSHELRTPLTEVYGYLELLHAYNSQIDETTQESFFKHAIEGCEELQRLVSSMLDTVHTDGQPKIPRLQDISVAQTIKEVLELFSPRTLQNYTLAICVPETLIARADQQYLRQILRNLLSNAFKYTPPHTLIEVSAAPGEDSSISGSSAPMVTICVKDNGPGIAAEDIPLLFEKFVRLKRDLSSSIRGNGLGLYISKQLVEAMGGRIWAESAGIAGQGSRFCFTLSRVTTVDEGGTSLAGYVKIDGSSSNDAEGENL
jgi:signal transduction histidine kinase